jgi:hypothetical protein
VGDRPFLRWLGEEHPGVGRFEQLGVDLVREYRVGMAQRPTNRGRLPEAAAPIQRAREALVIRDPSTD